MSNQDIFSEVDKQKDEITNALKELIRIPAISPQNGGEGEMKKAEKLLQVLATVGFDKIEQYDTDDESAPPVKRPNIVAYLYGEDTTEKLWIITHLDIVPPGEEKLWTTTKPYEPVMLDGKIYGRGSEDNNHSMVASIFAAKTLKRLGVKPKRTLALAFVADEEQGSKYGIQYLITKGLFNNNDLVVVPDSGNEDGSFIEISEKSGLWLKIRTTGIQTHASRPHKGINAHRVGMQFALALDRMLHEKYPLEDPYFDPPGSTFEPTVKKNNVDAINIAPGEDILYFDCRILPTYDLDEILANIQKLAQEHEMKTGAHIEIGIIQKSAAPKPTDANAKIVTMLSEAIRQITGTTPKVGGIGGGTCAAFFRKMGAPAVVWSTIDETAHQPNEYTKIQNLINDTRVYATLAAT